MRIPRTRFVLFAALSSVCLAVSPACASAEGSPESAKVDLSVLDIPGFIAEGRPPAQLTSLMTRWKESQDVKAAPAEKMREIYGRFADKSYAARQAASREMLALGPANVEALSAMTAGEQDPETAVRAQEIVAQWKQMRVAAVTQIRNVVCLWKALSKEEQVREAEYLVDKIRQLREEAVPPSATTAGSGRSRDELLLEIVVQLREHKTPEARAIIRPLLRDDSVPVVLRIIELMGSASEDPDAAPELIRLAEGKNKEVTLKALTHLSNWHGSSAYRNEITAMLKRLYDSKDEDIALRAAIISCYSGDGSGFPMILEATKSRNKAIACQAIGQLVDSRFQGRGNEIVPLLLPHLKSNDSQILERTIETMGSYPETAKDVIPFLDHQNPQIVWRAILALTRMRATEAVPALKALQNKTKDRTTLDYITGALQNIERKDNR